MPVRPKDFAIKGRIFLFFLHSPVLCGLIIGETLLCEKGKKKKKELDKKDFVFLQMQGSFVKCGILLSRANAPIIFGGISTLSI